MATQYIKEKNMKYFSDIKAPFYNLYLIYLDTFVNATLTQLINFSIKDNGELYTFMQFRDFFNNKI